MHNQWFAVAYLCWQTRRIRPGSSQIFATKAELIAMACTANHGLLLPEQVWDQQRQPANPAL